MISLQAISERQSRFDGCGQRCWRTLERRVPGDQQAPELLQIGVIGSADARVVAEWVEDEPTARMLRETGAEWGQGFYWAEGKVEPKSTSPTPARALGAIAS